MKEFVERNTRRPGCCQLLGWAGLRCAIAKKVESKVHPQTAAGEGEVRGDRGDDIDEEVGAAKIAGVKQKGIA